MTTLLRLTFISTLFLSCSSGQGQDCKEGINLLPMFGKQIKCEDQLKIDRQFLTESDAQFKNRNKAARFYVDKGWEYYYKNDLETSMKRFNQAWLLDTLNADIYWGFGNLLGTKGQFKGSIPLLQKSIQLNSANPKVYECIATSYGQLFFESKDINFLNKSIENLKSSVKIEPKNPAALAQLTAAYSYFTQKDSANKYLLLTDKLDPKAVNPEVRKFLKEN
jgi:tetratricopeptide (TPR) repeat protein